MRNVDQFPLLPSEAKNSSFVPRLLDFLRAHANSINEAANGKMWNFVSITATYTSGVNDLVILCNPAAATVITIPAASDMMYKRIVVKRTTTSTANGITVQSSSGNIDSAANTTINTSFGAKELFSDGAAYWTI